MDISPVGGKTQTKFFTKKWVKFLLLVVAIFAVAGSVLFWKAGNVINKITGGKGNIFGSILHSLPGVKDELKGEKDGRVNILLIGMRGENIPGGGLLADTVMIMSIKPGENKAAQISIPRDLYVTVPETADKQKINAVYFYGEQKRKGQGLEDMKKIVDEVSGLPIHYAASINFKGFTDLVNTIGGAQIHLDQSFTETMQFRGLEKKCDGVKYTVPSGNYEEKRIRRKNGTYYANPKRYPLCFEKGITENLECGGNFSLPAGDVNLNGDQALCYVRSRVTSSDFERAKRQQVVMQAIKDKLLSAGTFADFEKINGILNSLGDNLRTDMAIWEMKRFIDLYKEKDDKNYQVYQRVLENSEEGLLYNPPENGAGYILLPRGDNYDKIHEVCQNIFTLPPQSDIKPK